MRLKWTHPKFKNKVFRGSTVRSEVPGTKSKNVLPYWETTFLLVNVDKTKFETLSFESWQQAVTHGWERK